jgi:hypothetical protein
LNALLQRRFFLSNNVSFAFGCVLGLDFGARISVCLCRLEQTHRPTRCEFARQAREFPFFFFCGFFFFFFFFFCHVLEVSIRNLVAQLGFAAQTAASANWPGALEPILRHVEAAGLKLTGQQLLRTIGVTEVVSAVLLVIGNFIGLAGLANVVLIGVMGGAVLTHVRLNEPFALPLALIGALLVLLVLRVTAPRRHKKSASTKKQN